MPLLITEDWSGFDFQRGVSARQVFLATGFSDAESARAASPIQQGDRFIFDDTLIASMPAVATPKGAQNFVIAVQFSRSGGSGGGDGDPTNLLLIPPKYKWVIGQTTEPVDRDKYGNPITNSVIDPYASNPNDTFSTYTYTYKRYERVNGSVQQGPRGVAFSDTVNEGPISLPGFGDVLDKQAKLISINPETEFDRNTQAVLFTYTIEVRKNLDGLAGSAWKIRLLDKGRRANSGHGVDQLYVKNTDGKVGDPVNDDVLLDGQGIPINFNQYLIGREGDTPEGSNLLPAQVEKKRVGEAVFLYYERKETMPFNALGLVP